METLLSFLSKDISATDIIMVSSIVWLKSDIRRIQKTLDNGLVKKVSDLVTRTLLSSQQLMDFKKGVKEDIAELKENCIERRADILRQIEKS